MGDDNQFVSVWVAKGVRARELEKYLHVGYTEDGDALPSAFDVDFKLRERWDPCCREANAYPTAKPIRKLLERCSFSSSFIDDLAAGLARIEDTNWSAFILLFDYKCKRKRGTRGTKLPFVFVGAFPYDPDADPL